MDDIRKIRGYILQRQIGEGGFGKVYIAYQEFIQRFVAVKIIHNRYSNKPDFIRRFDAEARIIARLEHPHIVPLYDYWRDTSGSYLIMRLLTGGNLRDIISIRYLSLNEIHHLMRHLCDALETAHAGNVVHHDIKPENILVDMRGNAYLTDFGIAVDLTEGESGDTYYNVHYGSIDYSAPERLRERTASISSDIYSIGILLYEILAGELPFPDGTDKERREKYLHMPIPSLLQLRTDVSDTLMSVIWKATSKRPELRYPSIRELYAAITGALSTSDPHPIVVLAQTVQSSESLTSPSQHKQSSAVSNETAKLPNQMPPKPLTDPLATGRINVLRNIEYSLATGKIDTLQDIEDSLVTGKLPDKGLITSNLPAEIPVKRNPYIGLQAFDETDKDNFFGREATVQSLLSRLDGNQFLALIGPSGSGKSSIVHAGLIPELRNGALPNSNRWFIARMHPGNKPYEQLVDALESVAITLPHDTLDQIKSDTFALHQIIEHMLPNDETKLVLVIDQFEEIFTQFGDKAKQREFLQMLADTIEQSERFILVLTLRADFYDRPLNHPDFGTLLKAYTEVIVPLKPSELEAAIRQPAVKAGIDVEQQLIDTLTQELYDEQGMLPLLQFALAEIYERTQSNHTNQMTYATYQALGGLSGALANRANQVFDNLSPSEKEDAKRLFLLLITINRDSAPTRSRQIIHDLLQHAPSPENFNNVINQFIASRLLTTDRDSQTRLPTVEISHEAIIQGWSQLQQWIDENRLDLQRQTRLRDSTDNWLDANCDASYLARGAQLLDFENLAHSSTITISKIQQDFIDSSLEQSRRREQQRRIFIGVLITLTIVAIGLMVAALDRQRRADIARRDANIAARTAQSRELAALSQANIDENDLSLLLAVEAFQVSNTYEARNMLLTSLQINPRLERYLQRYDSAVRTLDIDPDDGNIYVGTAQGSVSSYDIFQADTQITHTGAHDGFVNSIAIQADGDLWASGGSDNLVIIWRDNAKVAEISVNDAVWSLAFGQDDRLLIGLANGDLLIWDTEEQDTVDIIQDAHTGTIYDITYSPDGSLVATGGSDNLIRLWDGNTFEPIGTPLEGHDNWVFSLEFHPRGQILASADADAQILLWDVEESTILQELQTDFQSFVRAIDFSPDGQLLAVSNSTTGQIYFWDLSTGERLQDIDTGHTGGIWALQFHPLTSQLITAGDDGNVLQWLLSLPYRPAIRIYPTNQVIENIHIYGNRIVTVGGASARPDGYAIIWDDAMRERLARLEPDVTTLDFVDANEKYIILASRSSTLIWVYDADSFELLYTLDEHLGFVSDIVLMSQEDSLISSSVDGMLIRWQLSDGEIVTQTTLESESVTAIAVENNNELLAIGTATGDIFLWNVETFTPSNEVLLLHEGAVTDLLFHPNELTLYSASRDHRVAQWKIGMSSSLDNVFNQHTDWVSALALSPDNTTLVSASFDNTIRLWDLATGRSLGLPMIGHTDRVTDVAFTTQGNLLSTSRDTLALEWIVTPADWIEIACGIVQRDFTEAEWTRYFSDNSYRQTCIATD